MKITSNITRLAFMPLIALTLVTACEDDKK